MLAQNSFPVGHRLGKRGWLVVCCIVLIVVVAFVYLALNWPFTEAAVIKRLEDASSSRVDIGSFHSTYFPHPGCVASQVVIYQGSRTDLAPLITIKQLTVRSSILGMLTKHVAVIKTDGMQVVIPRQSEHNFKSSSDTVIDTLIASDATLKFESHGKGKGVEFKIHEAELHNVGVLGAMYFRLRLSNPEPPGEVEASGTFGPWAIGHAGQTKVSGQYTFERADLSVFRGIAGMLSSKGTFGGTLEHIGVQGSTDTPEFAVTTSRHKTELKNQFDAVVDGTDGNVFLQHVDAQIRRTTISGKGEVAKREARARRAANLDLCSKDGRIQDLFLLFVTEDRSPITGTTNFCAHITLSSGKEPFLRKVVLVGDFGVDVGNFTKPETQENVNKLSAESVGGDDDKAATVLSSLRGHVEIKGGTAKFSNLSFGIPGALAQMHGNYDLVSHAIDLHGKLKMDSEPSHMAHGPKALLLKFVDPFFKKKQGSEVPVKITGTYEKPSFGLDLGGKKPNSASKQLQRTYQSRSKTKPTGEN